MIWGAFIISGGNGFRGGGEMFLSELGGRRAFGKAPVLSVR